MPELPDVEVLRRYLQSTALHKEIEDVKIYADRIIASGQTSEKKLKDKTVGHSFESTRRHGKWLFAALDNKDEPFLVFHFGMTGGLKYFKDLDDKPEYTQVLFIFDNDYQLAYTSMRKLGELEVIGSIEKFVDEEDLGPDALDPGFDLDAFKKAVADRHAMVKTTLMDQEIIAGIGNVYSDEILFQAGIYPRTEIDQLSEDKLEELFHTMKKVLKTAIKYQADPDKFPDSFIIPHRHKGGHCPECGADIKRVQVGSRHAYYCPNRQKKKEK